MKCRLLRAMGCKPSRRFPDGIRPAGTEIDHPDAFQLVRMGVAAPADAECQARANRTPEQIAEAARHYERLARGIHPTDWPAFDAGLMTGYDAQGNPIPGPNAPPPEYEGPLDLPPDFQP